MPKKTLEKVSPKLIRSWPSSNRKRMKGFQEDTKLDVRRRRESRSVRPAPGIPREFGKKLILKEIQIFSKLDPPVLRKPIVSHQRAPPHDNSPEFPQFYFFVKLSPGP